MINYNISINEELAQMVEQKIRFGKYANRSEFFRDLLRRFFVGEEELEIEPIMPGAEDYKKINKAIKNKKNFIPYSQIKRELNLK